MPISVEIVTGAVGAQMRLQPARNVHTRARLIVSAIITLAVVASLAAGPALADSELGNHGPGYGYQPDLSFGYDGAGKNK